MASICIYQECPKARGGLSDFMFVHVPSENYTFPSGAFGLRSEKSLGKSPRAFTGFKYLKAFTLRRVDVPWEVLELF